MKLPFGILTLLFVVSRGILAADKPEDKFEVSLAEKQVLDLTNAERAREKLPPLKPHPLLFRAARDHSKNMAKQGKMEHTLDGVEPHQRAQKAGFKSPWIGENIAAGEAFPPREVMKTWMESKGHRENILNADYVYIGIGVARSANGEFYYTQVFGRAPRP